MFKKNETAMARPAVGRDPFAFMQQVTDDFERLFGGSFAGFRWPSLLRQPASEPNWLPNIDVFERDKKLVAKLDLPGMTKNDVKVEVVDGYLSISGERKTEAEEKKDNFYRCEREYGSFYRTVPLPDGIKTDDVRATFADGVLEITIPLPAKAAAKPQQVEIQETGKATKSAA